jgi:lambda family phage portal protein
VIHHYAPLRSGQIRGVPWTVQALIKARDFDDYDDAELLRKKNRASYTGAIVRPLYTDDEAKYDPITGEPLSTDENGVPVMNVEPGSFLSMLPGEDVKLFEGDASGAGYADFVRQQLLGLAAALDAPYELLTGDMSKVNDRLVRVILNEFHRIQMQTQWLVTIPQICSRVWSEFIDAAVLSGALSAPDYFAKRDDYLKVNWQPQRWDYIHPLQDVEAAGLKIKYGLSSRKRQAAEQGEDIEEIDQENAEDKKRADLLGLNYETAVDPAADQSAGSSEQGAGA